MRINFVKDSNLKIRRKDRSDYHLQLERFAKKYCDQRHIDEPKLTYTDRVRNDDYFPQGEEYEDEIGIDEHQLGNIKKIQQKQKPPADSTSEEHDLFQPTVLFEGRKSSSRNPLRRFIQRVDSSIPVPRQAMLMTKRVSDKDAVEKLQALIEKATEFKRRVFRTKNNTAKSSTRTDEAKQEQIEDGSDNAETTKRPTSFRRQENLSSAQHSSSYSWLKLGGRMD